MDLFLESNTEDTSELLKKEAVEELRLKKDKMFDGDDLIFDHRTLEGLGNLYNSLVCEFTFVIVLIVAMVHSESERTQES